MQEGANHIANLKANEEKTCFRCAHSRFENDCALHCSFSRAINPCSHFQRIDWRDGMVDCYRNDTRVLSVQWQIHTARARLRVP